MISKKQRVKKPDNENPVFKKEAVKKPAEKTTKRTVTPKGKKEYLNISTVIELLNKRKKTEAIKMLKKFRCQADEPCGLISFRDNLCYNHYHMKLRFDRTSHVNKTHTGEKCGACKKREATNGKHCLACYLRLTRKGKIPKGKK